MPSSPSSSRIRIDVYTAAGVLTGSGPILSATQFSYSGELDRIGSFSFAMPATDPMLASVTSGRELKFYIEGEGLVFRGIVGKVEINSAEFTVQVSGSSIGRQMVWRLEVGRDFSGTAIATAIDALLAGTGWTRGTTGTPSTTLLQRIEAASVWSACADVATQFSYHIRENVLSKTLDIDVFGGSAGIMFTNLNQISPLQRNASEVVPITELLVEDESDNIWNSIVAWGAGEGVNKLTLKLSGRSTPYTISSAAGSDGIVFYYIEDAASVIAYGRRRKVLSVKDVQPISNTPAGNLAAANALYDVASSLLTRSKDPQTTYVISVVGMKHLNSGGSYRFLPGDKFRVRYNGVVTDLDGTKRSWRSVDTDLWLVSYERSFDESGIDTWNLKVATIDKLELTGTEQVGQALEELYTLNVAVKPYTYREIHGPERRSVDATHTATFIVDYDANVRFLHQTKLSVAVKPVRTNATGSSSGGGSTSSSGSSHSHTVSGQTASSGGGQTSSASGKHRHQMWGDDADNTHYDLGFPTGAVTTSPNTGAGSAHQHSTHAHLENLAAAYTQNATSDTSTVANESTHTHAMGAHAHYLTSRRVYVNADSNPDFNTLASAHVMMSDAWSGTAAYTYSAQSDHSHTVIDHTHTVTSTTSATESTHTHTVSAHTHSLTFGIYEGSGPTAAADVTVTINGVSRTVALGGPFDTDFLDKDITLYLVDGNGLPLQQRNTIVFGANELLDLEIVCKSIVTASALVPQ